MARTHIPLLPALGRVIVIPDTPITKVGSLVLPRATPKYLGEIVAVAPDVEDVAVGQRVIYARNVGVEIDVGETTYLSLRESDLLGVVP